MNMPDIEKKFQLRKKWGLIALVVLVCLNLVILGTVAGVAIKWSRYGAIPINQFFGPVGLGKISAEFGKQDREFLRHDLNRYNKHFEKNRIHLSDNHQRFIDLLKHLDFDQEKLNELFLEQRTMTTDRMEISHNILSNRISNMSHEERLKLSERIEHHGSKGRKSVRN